MLRKTHNQSKPVNFPHKKYCLPSSSQNRYQVAPNQQSRLNKIKRSINNKYKGTYSTSKNNSKRPSASKIQPIADSLNSQINFNNDLSFEIVGIRDAQSYSRQFTRQNQPKNHRSPLQQPNSNLNNHLLNKTKQTNFALNFGSQIDKNRALKSSKALQNISKINDLQSLTKNFPRPEEKKEFDRFLQNIHKDQNYQNTITMFTIMYFYEQRTKKQ